MQELKNKMEQELLNNILPFWMNIAVDKENGGFYGLISNDNTIDKLAPKGVILCSRILWTFSSAYRIYKNEQYLKLAEHAFDYIDNYFFDKENGGVFMLLDYMGKPLDDRKFLYAQSFSIYGLSEYYRASGEEKALKMAVSIFNKIEKNCCDKNNGGYFETFARDWSESGNNVLGDNHMNVEKSMNTHLHIMEGYTNLYRIYKKENLKIRLMELIELSLKHLIDQKTYHLNGFFDAKWNVKSDSFTFGHDIEASWLLFEAAEVLKDRELIEKCRVTAINIARVTLEQGISKDGSIFYEADSKGIIDNNREWWPQIEAVVGFINAFHLTEDKKFLNAAENCWNFIEEHLIDKINGEWFWGRKNDGTIMDKEKAGPWKCPYHNGRGCMEIAERYNRSLFNYTV